MVQINLKQMPIVVGFRISKMTTIIRFFVNTHTVDRKI